MTHQSNLNLAGGEMGAALGDLRLPFWGASAPLRPAGSPLAWQAPGIIAQTGVTAVRARAGTLPTEALLATLGARKVVWLRATAEDTDPATLLLNLIAAARRWSAPAGAATLELMGRRLGPLLGWPELFEALVSDLASGIGAAVLVIEDADVLVESPALRLLGGSLLARLPADSCCVLLAEQVLPPGALPPGTIFCEERDLALSEQAARELLAELAGDLPRDLAGRLVGLADGRALVLSGAAQALAVLGQPLVAQAARKARTAEELLTRLARAWLGAMCSDDWLALALALRLGYSHPSFLLPLLGRAAPPEGPWLQPLAEGWLRVQPIWQAPLRAALGKHAWLGDALLSRAATRLADLGFATRAVTLALGAHDDTAAELLEACAERMSALGQWELLNRWLEHLPEDVLQSRPGLSYTRGELAGASGQLELARRCFGSAAAGFAACGAAEGACRSTLAASTVALWQGDVPQARHGALAAYQLAETGALPLAQGWAAWQAGCLAASASELDHALGWFGQARTAASRAGAAALLELIRLAEDLAMRQRVARRERANHLRAYVAAEHDERALQRELQRLLEDPAAWRDELLASQAWPQLPLLLKLGPPRPEARASPDPAQGSIWRALLRRLGWGRSAEAAQPAAERPQAAELPELPVLAEIVAETPQLAAPLAKPAGAAGHDAPLGERAVGSLLAEPAVARDAQPVHTLTAYLLGLFRVLLNDQPVQSWPSGRGRAIFKYLLSHRERPTPRDVLMDLFWPEAEPDAARNNLNVAIHGLRQALRMPDGLAVVLFHEGAYQLNSALDTWVDVEEFDRLLAHAQRMGNRGATPELIGALEQASVLYQGDLLEDDPYEEWPVLTRERLRVAYLDALARLSEIRFEQGQHAACAAICQQMLARDSCREDVHRRLMQCYARQGQRYLALRQFQACADALRAELNIAPEPATAELHERIRRREAV